MCRGERGREEEREIGREGGREGEREIGREGGRKGEREKYMVYIVNERDDVFF